MRLGLLTFVLLALTTGEVSVASAQELTATYYDATYNGGPLWCGGIFDAGDATIAAVGPAHYADIPCGARVTLVGPAGTATVTRQDACPGCSASMIDLSERANELVCGAPAHTCEVEIQR